LLVMSGHGAAARVHVIELAVLHPGKERGDLGAV
jgi:hypothetical protein